MGALAVELAEAEHAKLPDAVKGAYVKQADGKYKLDFQVEDNSGLKSALEKEREDRKKAERAMKDLAATWEGLDASEVRKLLEKLGGDEEAQLIKAGKIDEVVNRRTERLRAAHDKALKDAATKAEKAEQRAKKFSDRVLDNHIRAAATRAKLHEHAVEDALFRARTIFSLNEDGDPVQMRDGEVVRGKDGKTPFTPSEWLDSMKESAPHWFPAGNSGSGAGGGGKGGGGKVIKRAQFDAMSEADRREHFKGGGTVED